MNRGSARNEHYKHMEELQINMYGKNEKVNYNRQTE